MAVFGCLCGGTSSLSLLLGLSYHDRLWEELGSGCGSACDLNTSPQGQSSQALLLSIHVLSSFFASFLPESLGTFFPCFASGPCCHGF